MNPFHGGDEEHQFAVEVVVGVEAFPDAGDAAFGVNVFEAAFARELTEVFALDLAGDVRLAPIGSVRLVQLCSGENSG